MCHTNKSSHNQKAWGYNFAMPRGKQIILQVSSVLFFSFSKMYESSKQQNTYSKLTAYSEIFVTAPSLKTDYYDLTYVKRETNQIRSQANKQALFYGQLITINRE